MKNAKRKRPDEKIRTSAVIRCDSRETFRTEVDTEVTITCDGYVETVQLCRKSSPKITVPLRGISNSDAAQMFRWVRPYVIAA